MRFPLIDKFAGFQNALHGHELQSGCFYPLPHLQQLISESSLYRYLSHRHLAAIVAAGVRNRLYKGKDPKSIIKKFFSDFAPNATREELFDLLFNFIQYTERQVVLFDSIEDAAFEEVNDLTGKGTLNELLLRAESEGVMEDLKRKLNDFSIRVVLTAHPTQFYPGNVLAIINDLEEAIRDGNLEHINLLLRQLGKTAFINREKPTPFGEAISLSWFLEHVFYEVIPEIILKLMKGLQIDPEEWKNYDLIKIGFWPGGRPRRKSVRHA